MKKLIKIIALILAMTFVFAACGSNGADETTTSSAQSSESAHSQVKFTMENGGAFIVELYPEYAPKTVENFLELVESGYYNGLTFHRVMEDFMAQGGEGAKTDKIVGEFSINGFEQNTLSHTRGVISMARTNDYNSASSQFFICYADATFLDGQYAAFGKVIEGMEVVDGFLEVERTYNSRGELAVPVDPIVIETAEVI